MTAHDGDIGEWDFLQPSWEHVAASAIVCGLGARCRGGNFGAETSILRQDVSPSVYSRWVSIRLLNAGPTPRPCADQEEYL